MRDVFRELPKRRRFEDTAHIANKAPKSPTMRVLSHPTCKNTIAGAWSRPIRGIKQLHVMQKMKSLKGPLRTLTVTEFGHISERAKRAQEAYGEAVDAFDTTTATQAEKGSLYQLKKQALFLEKAEGLFISQKLKMQHLIKSDRSTSYYHGHIKERKGSTMPAILD